MLNRRIQQLEAQINALNTKNLQLADTVNTLCPGIIDNETKLCYRQGLKQAVIGSRCCPVVRLETCVLFNKLIGADNPCKQVHTRLCANFQDKMNRRMKTINDSTEHSLLVNSIRQSVGRG